MRIYLEDDWIRAAYYDRLMTICEELFTGGPPFTLRVLEYAECSGIIPKIISEFATVHLTLAPYPEYDIQGATWQFNRDFFDVVIADQVLEHVPHPWQAVEQCVGITKPGGILIFGTPWVYPYHAAPQDYWRISRDAYQMMFDEFGVETIEIGGWGSREILQFALETDGLLRGVDEEGKPMRTVAQAEAVGLFEMQNDPDYSIEVWAIGRKQ